MDFVVLDFETTGLRNEDTIIEIGYVWIRDGRIQDERSTLIHPGRSISGRITRITGITNEMVKDAPALDDVIEGFSKFLRGKMIVAHNASFDMRFLNNALTNAGLPPIEHYICTMRMFRAYKKAMGISEPGAKLSDLTAFFTLNNERAHRALEDAQVTAKAFLSMGEVLKWEAWVSGPKKKASSSGRAGKYEALFENGTPLSEVADLMGVKGTTVNKYFADWLTEQNYSPYLKEIRSMMPHASVAARIIEAARFDGRVNHIFRLLDGEATYDEIQLVIKLKRLGILSEVLNESNKETL